MELGLGKCPVHDRPYEGLCKGCEVIVCPSCVLFGEHKKHDIVSFREGAMFLRKEIDKRMYKGYFKKEHTESKVLEVKQALLLLEKNKSEIIKKIEETFKGISHTLKNRKAEVINELIEKFAVEKDKIDNAEADWECRQEISEKLNQFDKDDNSGYLLLNSKFILEGIRKISEPTQFNELNIFTNFDSSLYVDLHKNEEDEVEQEEQSKGKEFTIDELSRAFETFAALLEPKMHSYNA